ncbi:MAG TPA: DUF3841 domain-containing protein [Thermoanaerobaculia bacterium]|jgi:hypothetical protein|nr:DUF3841 domain-containing protein [Thermoanaerobaculia bacterium]
MILWSIQQRECWLLAQKRGAIRADGRRVWRSFKPAYRWMRDQLMTRLGRPPAHITYPTWAWLQYKSADRPRPDLRHSAHLSPGTQGVVIEFEIAPEHVLLSDFDLWHYVLNDSYLPAHRGDDRDSPSSRERRRSWERIFDMSFSSNDVAVPFAQKSVQASLWQIPLEAVKSVREFIARERAA